MLTPIRPITLADIFSATFRPMTLHELKDTYQGIEGTGSVAEYSKGGVDYLFVMDTIPRDDWNLCLQACDIKIEVFTSGQSDEQRFEIKAQEIAV